MHIPHGRWHSNFAWHPGSECQTHPTVIFNPFRAMLFICYTPAQRLGFSRTAPYQWCLSLMYSPADAAYSPRNAEPARLHFLPASLAPPAFHGGTPSGWAGCLHCQILLLLSRHPTFHGCSQSLHIASPDHPAACGTWSRLIVSRWTILFPTFHLLPIRQSALLALAIGPTHCTPSILFYCCPGHPEPTQVSLTLHMTSCARPPFILAAGHQRGTLPLHRRACIHLPPAPHFAPPPERIYLSAIAAFVPLPATPSQRLPSSPPLIPASTQFVPIPFQSLTSLLPNFLSH
jgi:hypothetical protein